MAITPTVKIGGVPGGVRQLLNTQILAATGSTIDDAALITVKGPAVVVGTGGNATKGIKLPKSVPGKNYRIKNSDAANAVLKVYPYESTSVINGASAGVALSMAAKTSAEFICTATGFWITIPLLPS